jgi:hypothetical protein
LDKLYKPKPGVEQPDHYTQYSNELRPDAIARLIDMLE